MTNTTTVTMDATNRTIATEIVTTMPTQSNPINGVRQAQQRNELFRFGIVADGAQDIASNPQHRTKHNFNVYLHCWIIHYGIVLCMWHWHCRSLCCIIGEKGEGVDEVVGCSTFEKSLYFLTSHRNEMLNNLTCVVVLCRTHVVLCVWHRNCNMPNSQVNPLWYHAISIVEIVLVHT